jgi:hypothetical protein
MSDHMSRNCPNAGQKDSQHRRTERDTLSGTHFIGVELILGNGVTSNEPLPSWEPIVPEVAAQGWGGAATQW